MPGVVIAPKPGDRLNGVPIVTPGASYLMRLDDGLISGSVCPVDNLRPAGGGDVGRGSWRQSRSDGYPGGGGSGGTLAHASLNPRALRLARAARLHRGAQPAQAEQARMLVLCGDEHVQSNLLYLDEHLTVQAGGTRKYIYFQDNGASGIDTTPPVLPIRGSMDA